jgi:PAS domain S-box-containing protein
LVELPQSELLVDLYRLVDRLSATKGLQAALDEVLNATLDLLNADMGHVRLVDGKHGLYSFAAARGFPQEYIDYFASLPEAAIQAGPALQSQASGKVVIVEDVETHPPFAGHLDAIRNAGYVAMLAHPLVDRDGRVIGSLSAHFKTHKLPGANRLEVLDLYARLAADAIERASHEEALAVSEARYKALADLSPDAILVNKNQRWAYANASALHLLRAEHADQVLGHDPQEFIHPDFRDAARRRREAVLRGETVANPLLEQRWYRVDGTLVDCEVASGTITWEGGPAVLIICRDVSDRKLAEEALRQAAQLKDEFLGLVSHELRTPLTTIRGYAGLLARKSLPPDLMEESLADLLSESERLNNIVENMLALTRVEVGQMLPSETFEPLDVIKGTVSRFLNTQPTTIELGDFPENCRVVGVPPYLEQVVQNLLTNARKYSPAGAPITITGRIEDGFLCVCVADRGRGISDNDAIFQAFVREQGTAQVSGLGIGLTVCKRLTEAQGGSVRAEPREGGGTIFTFTLPLAH